MRVNSQEWLFHRWHRHTCWCRAVAVRVSSSGRTRKPSLTSAASIFGFLGRPVYTGVETNTTRGRPKV